MDQNVVFQKDPNNPTNVSQNDALDPFAKYENQPSPQSPPVNQTEQPLPPSPIFPQNIPNPLGNSQPIIPPPLMPPLNPTSGPPPPPSILSGIPSIVKIVGGVIIGIVFLLFIIVIVSNLNSHNNKVSKNVTLEYWELWEDKNTLNQLFSEFHRQYPNITVDVVQQDPKQYVDRVITRVRDGSGPDLFTYHNSWTPELLPVLSPLSTQAISVSDFNKSFYPVAQNDLSYRGAIYGIPLEIDTLGLFVNNDILQAAGVKAPTTWNDFNTIASQTTVKDQGGKIKTAGAAIGTYDNITHAPDILAMLFAQNGANQSNLTSTQKNASEALTFYTSYVSNAQENVWDNTLPNSLIAFAQGNAAMIFGYSYDIFTLRVMNPTLNFSVYPVPHLPNRPITTASYWVQGVSVRSTHQKEAMLLMHFLSQKDTEEKLYSLESKTRPFGEPYARMDLADTLKNDPFVYPFITQAKTAVSTYFSSNTNDTGINGQMNGYLGNAIRSVLTGTSADSAITTLAQGVTQILQQYGQQ